MGLIDFLRNKTKTAETAKNRLQIIIAQERTQRGGPDYLPLLQRELLEVIKKYVKIDVDAVKVDLIKDGPNDVLDISVALPDDSER
ncbi:MAG TPA: cell division topological specificity factor MinE [Xylella taiwanensis]